MYKSFNSDCIVMNITLSVNNKHCKNNNINIKGFFVYYNEVSIVEHNIQFDE